MVPHEHYLLFGSLIKCLIPQSFIVLFSLLLDFLRFLRFPVGKLLDHFLLDGFLDDIITYLVKTYGSIKKTPHGASYSVTPITPLIVIITKLLFDNKRSVCIPTVFVD